MHTSHFSIECREDHEDPKISDDAPLTTYQALQSLIDFGSRYGVRVGHGLMESLSQPMNMEQVIRMIEWERSSWTVLIRISVTIPSISLILCELAEPE